MKKPLPSLPQSDMSICGLPYQALKWEIFKTGLKLEIFDTLAEPQAASQVAEALGTHPGNTEYLLNALVALGLAFKEDGRFGNTEFAATFFTSGKDTSLGGSLLYMAGWTEPVLNGAMLEMVRNGPPPPKKMEDPAIWENGARNALNFNRCGRAQALADLVSSLPEFPSFTRMLDMGAGPGIIGIAVAAAHPSIKCVLCDQPPVCKVAEEVIAEYGMEERVTTLPCNYMDDPIGQGYDFIMANYTLNFYKNRLDEVMDKVRDALNPGGVFMVTSDGMDPDMAGPAASVITWLPTQLQGTDFAFESGLISKAMSRAGLESEHRTLANVDLEAHGPVELTLGRKRPAS